MKEIQKEQFKEIVITISEAAFCKQELKKYIELFEERINQTNKGKACFSIVQSDYKNIEIMRNPPCYKFQANYYDGFARPQTVCAWDGTINELLELIYETSPKLYNMCISKCLLCQ